jgi:hypothetical protein
LIDVENDLKKIGVRGWSKIARDRDIWKLILKEAKVLHGPYFPMEMKRYNRLVLWLGSI